MQKKEELLLKKNKIAPIKGASSILESVTTQNQQNYTYSLYNKN